MFCYVMLICLENHDFSKYVNDSKCFSLKNSIKFFCKFENEIFVKYFIRKSFGTECNVKYFKDLKKPWTNFSLKLKKTAGYIKINKDAKVVLNKVIQML